MQNIHTSSDIKLQNTHTEWHYHSYVASIQILFLGVESNRVLTPALHFFVLVQIKEY